MNTTLKSKLLTLAISCAMVFMPLVTAAEDIDIFVGSSAGSAGNANVLIVLDNTTNWADQAQHWPDGTQGYSEVMSIKDLASTLKDNINVGLMMYPINGGGSDGGFIRQAVVPMTDANKTVFMGKLDAISTHINGTPNEAASSSRANGTILFDAYKYFGGYTSPAHAQDGVAGTPKDSNHYGATPFASSSSVPTSYADEGGYTSAFTEFKSPISSANSCARNYVIYIGNGFPSGSDSSTLLSNVGCGTALLARPNLTSSTTNTATTLGTTAACYATQAVCTSGSPETTSACPAGNDSCACSTTVTGGTTCASGQSYYTVTKSTSALDNASNSTYSKLLCQATDPSVGSNPKYVCPVSGASGSCAVSVLTGTAATAGCNGNNKNYQSIVTRITTNTTSQCYLNTTTCGATEGGVCSAPTSTNACASGTSRYSFVGNVATTTTTSTGTSSVPSGNAAKSMADVWAKCLYQTDANAATGQQNVATYSIDVYNAKPDANQNALLYNMAHVGGGKYFAAKNKSAIINALKEIFAEIQGVNSTFASASLPVNATNRSQNENQVFIGMFRPDPDAKPRWFGNLKRYQLVNSTGAIKLGDMSGKQAVNSLTGFISDCATSYWTTNSNNYWENVIVNPPPSSGCTTSVNSVFSDEPDGPTVEKGAVAEVLRKGNNSPSTDTSPTWTVNRTIYTLSGSSMVPFNTTNVTSITADAVNFTRGKDVMVNGYVEKDYTGLISPLPSEPTRPSIHGDVIHSRPLPINYGATTGVTVYYGANDGHLRAVNASTGNERWAFVAPETISNLPRLMEDLPLVNYPSLPAGITPTPTAKNYFFDGSIGVYQNADNSDVRIFPTMRRGGRTIYGFNVTNPASPAFLWKVGCPNLANDTGCTTGMGGFGQSWSLPNVAFIKGYSETAPVIIVGGGYDNCEDSNSASPSCGSTKGAGVYVLNATTGAVIASFSTDRSVPADVALIDVDYDGKVDYAYAVDTGGNVYRIDFVNSSKAALTSDKWTKNLVAYTKDAGRKFMYPPALFANSGKVYVAIGSGDREHPLQTQYPYSGVKNRFYVYLDDLAAISANNLDDTSKFNDLTTNTSCTDAGVLPTSSIKGWFMDLNQYGQGEQTVSSALIVGGLVTFSSNRPIAPAAGTCATTLGEARGYWVNLFNGSGAIGVAGSCAGARSSIFVGGGLPPSPVMGTVSIDGKPTTVVIGAPQKDSNVSSPIAPQQVKPNVNSKRKIIYWKSSGDN